MKVGLITLWVLSVLGTALAQAEPVATPQPPKASSLAPRAHGGSRTYGTPIQPRILSHVYRKPRRVTPATAAHR
jgi:hypothetical protein